MSYNIQMIEELLQAVEVLVLNDFGASGWNEQCEMAAMKCREIIEKT